jgi:hypothetical protein
MIPAQDSYAPTQRNRDLGIALLRRNVAMAEARVAVSGAFAVPYVTQLKVDHP